MNISTLIAHNAFKYPMKEAVVDPYKRYSYKQLNDKVNRFASQLVAQGFSKGSKIIIFMPNVVDFAVVYFAIQRIGAIVVPVNAKFTQPEIEFIIDHAGADALIAHELLFEQVKGLSSRITLIKTGAAVEGWLSLEQMIDAGDDMSITCDLKEDDESTILYTSGTTGDPKGVLFSNRNILTVATMIAVEMEVKPESRILLMMPLSHSAPLHLFFIAGCFVGATNVLVPTFTPDLLIDIVEREKTTHFFGAPVAYLLTAKHPQIGMRDLSSMKWWVYGGAPLSADEVTMIQQAFKTNRLTCVYGLTEAGPSGSLLFAEEHGEKTGSIGKRSPLHTELRIIREDGEDVAIGEVGEIILRGEGNMIGYYNNPQATEEVFFGDWVRSGDLARFDDDGYIWIVDRKKDVIISGGVTIYPKEVEDALLLYPSLQEVAIIGLPHPEWGETIVAYFAATERIAIEQLKEFLAQRLAAYKIPKIFEQMEALPRNASGKILKRQLKMEE
ncbi:class I adenylate-forming enzyme family protein [Kurthia sibirica]|uniref:O-succinylbenzoate--CoA ligase n=1 Tax=Kurthia sibirica TaxID=202750 RepID=A0A2U3APT4_9BACL|nr:AMP-binding protein [Kurthia sibirica]PWI26534.1 o-succinylbenzoate--CoA ligase [Kurthia sibirica]GEK32779.1 fatty-acid CoA ligase [Kurthia sibirica]